LQTFSLLFLMYNYDYLSSPTLTNVTISGNSAGIDGGGMYNYGSSPVINNSIIWGNTTLSGTSKSVHNDFSGTATFTNCLVEGNTSGGVWDGTLGTEGIVGSNLSCDADPQFVGWIDPDDVSTTMPNTLGDYRLQTGSPAIDAGDNSLNSTATDLFGTVRILNSIIDLGAYEYDISAITQIITITTQPAATTTVTEGSISGSLSIAASVAPSGTPAYQWFVNTTNSATGGTSRSEERPVGKDRGSSCRSRWSPYH
jgi:hypothetical protein